MLPVEIVNDMKAFSKEARKELTDRIIPYWKNLRDNENGGYYGYVGYDQKVNPQAEKGGILNSRILYFFSEAYLLLGDESLLDEAKHAFTFLKEHFLDQERGGIYWSLDYKGNPLDTTKHTYCQAFAIYGLCSFYKATHEMEAFQMACNLYQLIETKMKDDGGYLEAFDVDFHPASNEKLSENGVSATRTMNTILHVLEAYTSLYACAKVQAPYQDTVEARVEASLRDCLNTVLDKIYNPSLRRQEVFFDAEYNTLIDLYSYGHDIEAAWLLDLAADTLDYPSIRERVHRMSAEMEAEVYKEAFDGRSIPAECEAGKVLEDRVWWVQAEGVNGYLHAYLKNPEEKKYYDAARAIFQFIETKVVDPRANSEWYWMVDKDGNPAAEPLTTPWKCPYHNGRMCFEIIRSIENAAS